jgi:hypothetical protein
LRVEESTPQSASNPPPRQETAAILDQMDLVDPEKDLVVPEKEPAPTNTVMPAMGMVNENDDEDEIDFDDDEDIELEEI